MRNDVVELRQIETDRGGKIDGMKLQVRYGGSGRQPARMIDVGRHRIDTVEFATRMGCGKNRRGDSLAAAEIAPRKTGFSGGGLDPGDQRHMIEPGRCQHWFEIPQIRDVGRIAVNLSDHCLAISCRGALSQMNGEPYTGIEQSG